MKRILLVLSIFFLGMSLMGCRHDSQKKPNDSMPEKFKPVLNPNPKYFMTVKGMIDPKLKDTIHLQWIATYNTTSDQCLKTINDFEGVHAPYEKKITMDVTTNINGNYQYKIPLDHYLPGFCGWESEALSFVLNGLGETTTAFFTNKKTIKSKKTTHIISSCSRSICKLDKFETFNNSMTINPLENYFVSLNIMKLKGA